MRIRNALKLVSLGIVLLAARAHASTSYHIGNSLTWDMLPWGLSAMASEAGKSHQTGYHITSGQDLTYIWNNPTDTTYTNAFGEHVNALPSNHWDFVTIQPFYKTGSTLGSDLTMITRFIDATLAGPSVDPTFFIYAAWPGLPIHYPTTWNQSVANDADQQTLHNRDYFTHLYDNVTTHYSDSVDVFVIPIGEVIFRLDQEFKEGKAPGYWNARDLYRDFRHLTNDVGRFIAATTVYATMFREDPTGLDRPAGFYPYPSGDSALTDEFRTYLQRTVWDVVSQHPDTGIDIEPEPFSFTDITDASLGDVVVSDEITVSGINATTSIEIADGEYSLNGSDYTNSAGSINNGDRITVRVTASSAYASSVSTALTIGSTTDAFSVITMDAPVVTAPPVTPEPPLDDDKDTGDVEVVSDADSASSSDSAALSPLTGIFLLLILATSRGLPRRPRAIDPLTLRSRQHRVALC